MNTDNLNINEPDRASNMATPQISSANLTQGGQTISTIKEPPKSNKTSLWVGICLVILAMAIIFGLVVIPRTVHPCSIFSSYSHISLCSGFSSLGLLCSFFLGIPLNVIGASRILSSITKKIKHKEAVTVTGIFLIIVFNVALTIYLLANFIK